MSSNSSTARVWKEARRSLLIGATLLVALASCLIVVLRNMPALEYYDLEELAQFPPNSLEQIMRQRDILLNYAATNPVAIVLGFCACYILMQTFALPGTLTLSLLGGALYGVTKGSMLVSVISTLGSCSCYCLSWLLGKQLALAIWPQQLQRFEAEADARRGDMLNYIIFLRVTPILPNTFINVASPIVGVPLIPFMAGTLLGCMPNNFVAVNAGSKLGELQSLTDLYDVKMLGLGVVVGIAALFPLYLKRRQQKQLQQQRVLKAATTQVKLE